MTVKNKDAAAEAIRLIREITTIHDAESVFAEVRDHLRRLRAAEANEKILSGAIRVGQRVYFDARTRGGVTGTVLSIAQKTARVRTDAGVEWKVAISLLHPVQSISEAPGATRAGA